jgi:hypothetical protein
MAGNGLKVLSPQQLVDCAKGVTTGDPQTEYENEGCNGGWYYWAWNYLKLNGQELDADYPYTATDGTCTYNAAKGVAQVKSWTNVSDYKNQTFSEIQGAMMNAL